MPKAWGDNAQAVGTQCPRLGQPCSSACLYSYILFLLSIDIQNPFYKIKRQKKVRMGIKEKGRKKEKGNNSYSRRRVCNQEYKGEI